MWFCFNDAFVSAVQDRNDGSKLCVRARKRDHLQRLFPDLEIIRTPDADYACRAFVPKDRFVEVVAKRVNEISYPNFKNSVREAALHELYAAFWALHRDYQEEIANGGKRDFGTGNDEDQAVTEDAILQLMKRLGIPLTRENYIGLSCGSDGSVEWGPEHEAELPDFLREDRPPFAAPETEEKPIRAYTKDDLLRWIATARSNAADSSNAGYWEALERFVATATDRRDHLSWGEGDVEIISSTKQG